MKVSTIATPRYSQADIIKMMAPVVEYLKRLDSYDEAQGIIIHGVWATVRDYDCYKYLTYLFLKGKLNACGAYNGPIQSDHIESIPTLLALNEAGVITTSGQRAYIDISGGVIYRQRSYLNFIIRVRDDFNPLAFSRRLYEMGVQVSATITICGRDLETFTHNSNPYENYLYWDLPKFPHGKTNLELCEIEEACAGIEEIAVSREETAFELKNLTWGNPGFVIDEFADMNALGWNRIYSALIVSKSWDDIQCDEVLLKALASA